MLVGVVVFNKFVLVDRVAGVVVALGVMGKGSADGALARFFNSISRRLEP